MKNLSLWVLLGDLILSSLKRQEQKKHVVVEEVAQPFETVEEQPVEVETNSTADIIWSLDLEPVEEVKEPKQNNNKKRGV